MYDEPTHVYPPDDRLSLQMDDKWRTGMLAGDDVQEQNSAGGVIPAHVMKIRGRSATNPMLNYLDLFEPSNVPCSGGRSHGDQNYDVTRTSHMLESSGPLIHGETCTFRI